MKAPITPAQAWAVIAESSGWSAKELPVLPEPEFYATDQTDRFNDVIYREGYDADQLQAYGDQRAAHAREELAKQYRAELDKLCLRNYELRKEIEALKGK